jgi:hypothetical protein
MIFIYYDERDKRQAGGYDECPGCKELVNLEVYHRCKKGSVIPAMLKQMSTQPSTRSNPKYCPNCFSIIVELGANFCSNCGRKLRL